MAYGQDTKNSARRHLKAAQILYKSQCPGAQPGCRAVAGYLFGLAGELAVKHMMRDSGMKVLDPPNRREDPFYQHFPLLRSVLAEHARGRRQGELLKIVNNQSLFAQWDTDMRYAPTSDVETQWVDKWKASAEQLVQSMEAL